MPVTVQTPAITGRSLVSSDWDTIIPVSGSGTSSFSLSLAILNGNIGKFIKLLPTAADGTVAIVTAVTNPQAELSAGQRTWVAATLPFTGTALDSTTITDKAGTSRALFVWGAVAFDQIQNLAKIQVVWKGTAYDSLIPPPPGATLTGRSVFCCAIPLGNLSADAAGAALALQVVQVTAGTANATQAKGASWRWACVSNNNQTLPAFDLAYVHSAIAASATRAVGQVNTQQPAGFAYGTSTRRGALIVGQTITPAAVTILDNFAIGPSSDQTAVLTGREPTAAGAPVAMTFDYSAGGAAAGKIGYVIFSSNPTSGGGGNGVTIISTAASLVSSGPMAPIVLTVIDATTVEVAVA